MTIANLKNTCAIEYGLEVIEASPQLSIEDSEKIIKEVNTKPHYKRGQRKREAMGKNDKTFLK